MQEIRAPGSAVGSFGAGIKNLTLFSLLGLGVGVLAGSVATGSVEQLEVPLTVATALVQGWTNGLRLLVVPLVVAQLFLAMTTNRSDPGQTRPFGVLIPIVFVGLLVLTAGFTVAAASALLSLPFFGEVTLGATPPPVGAVVPGSVGAGWVDAIIPPNLFAAAAEDQLLPLMILAGAFGFAVRRADSEARETLRRVVQAISEASFTMVGWLLWLTPLVMVALGFKASHAAGWGVGQAILKFAALEGVIVLLVVLLLYPLTILVARVPLKAFARALWPAQLMAMASRSSLATIPALLGTTAPPLSLRSESVAYVVPLAGATLKLSRAVSGPAKLLFLAHVLGVPLGVEQIVVFAATIIVLSASTVGVPSVTSMNRSLPAFVAVGVPPEYVVLLGVAVSITDVVLTLLNTSGYLAAAAIVDRLSVRREGVVKVPVPAAAVS